jgi:TPR repeat protein
LSSSAEEEDRTIISVLVFLYLGLTNPALADKRVALIVANGAPLENPTPAADLVAASLTNIGFGVKVMKNADLDAFDGVVTAFADTAKSADIALTANADGKTSEHAAKALIAECDRLAASPDDVSRPAGVAGVAFDRIDAARAVPACRAAMVVSRNDPRIALQLGRALDKAGGADAEAVALYRKAADAGDAVGMADLGLMYENGTGVSKDAAEAARWYRKAVDAGDARGMTYLGLLYENGTGVSKDAAEAARWFRKAVDAGNASGMTYLGLMYANGVGVTKDAAEAVPWFRKAADAGDGAA